MNRFVQVGQSMWQMLADTFTYVMRANEAAYAPDKAKVWAGFMSAASGAMARDLGADDAKTVLQGILGAMDVVTTQETSPVQAVSDRAAHLADVPAPGMHRNQVIARARMAHGGKWPADLTSGVMFYEGMRVTREDFEHR